MNQSLIDDWFCFLFYNLHFFCFISGISGALNLVFALDGSNRINESTYNKIKNFATASLQSYPVSSSQTHIGIVNFGADPSTILQPGYSFSKTSIRALLKGMNRVGGDRRLDKALNHIDKTIFARLTQARPNASKALIILTMGENAANERQGIIEATRSLKQEGVNIVVVGIGADTNKQEMQQLASNPAYSMILPTETMLPTVYGQVERAVASSVGKC